MEITNSFEDILKRVVYVLNDFIPSLELNAKDFMIIIFGTIFSLILGYTIKIFPRLVSYIYSYFEDDPKIGSWYLYHYSLKDGRFELCVQELKIKKGFKEKYNVHLNDLKTNKVLYHGSLDFEGTDYIFHFKATYSEEIEKETFLIRAKKIFWDDKVYIPGLYVGVSFDHLNYATTCLLSKTDIMKNDYDSIIKEYFKFDEERAFLFENKKVVTTIS